MSAATFSPGQNLSVYDILPPQSADYNMVLLRSHIRGMCNGEHCAGFLLEFLLFYHKGKVGSAVKKKIVGQSPSDIQAAHVAGMFDQWHTKEELQAHLGGLYGKNSLVEAERILCDLGYIRKYKKPYENRTDNTNRYHINDDVLRACEAHYWECFRRGEVAVFAKNDTGLPFEKGQTTVLIQTGDQPKTNEHSQGTPTRYTFQGSEDNTTSCIDEGPSGASSVQEIASAPESNNTAMSNQGSNTPNREPIPPAYSKKSKPRHKPAPLPAHPAIPFMQELARTLAPILEKQAHSNYPSEGETAYKYHLDALDAYDAIQTGAILARPLDRPDRYLSPAVFGNPYRLEQLKLWAKDPKAMEATLLASARIYATTRSKNQVVAKLPNVAYFLFGSTTAGGFLPWWNHVKPLEAMEAKEKAVLQKVEREEGSKPKLLEMEERGQIERDDFYHRKFVKLFGREPKQFKETAK